MTVPLTLQELWLGFREHGHTPVIIATGRDGAVRLSFADVFGASRQLAKDIISRGLKRGSVISIMAANSPAWIEAFFGIVAAGGVAMPIDVQISDEDLQRMLVIGECRLVISEAPEIERLQGLVPMCEALDIDASAITPEESEPFDTASLARSDPGNIAILTKKS